ncbi:hypothetical protein QTP88_018261 [Uroleucon formosanum]
MTGKTVDRLFRADTNVPCFRKKIPSPRVVFNERQSRRHLEKAATSQEFHTWSGPFVSEVMALFRRRRPLRGGSPGHCRPRSFRHHRATTDQPTGARASRRRTHRARKMPTGTDGIFFGSGRCTTVCKRDDNGCGPRGSWFLFVISTRKSPPPPHRSTLPTIHRPPTPQVQSTSCGTDGASKAMITESVDMILLLYIIRIAVPKTPERQQLNID